MKLTALWSPEQQFQHKNGAILTNGKIYVYLAGRTELAQIYVDDDGIHQGQNPVTLDDNGRAVVFADEAYSYTAVVCDNYGQELFSFKPIGLGGPGSEAPKQVDIQSNSLNVEKSYNERTNTETFTLEVKNSDCKSWIGRDGQSSVIPADTEVEPLALPQTNEYDGDFIDRIENDNTIFLKEGLYHVDCVIEFTQAADSEENKFGQIEVFTGLGNGDESTNLEINETGPLCDDEVRHCIKQTFIRKVKAGSDLASSELYFRPMSPVPLSSCKIKSLSIVELSVTGNTEGANYYPGEHVEITDNNIINVTGLQPSGNYANAESVAQAFYGVAQDMSALSGAIDDVASSIPSIEGLASEEYVDEHIDEAVSGKADRSEIPSLEGYATESWVQNQHYLTSVPDQYATDAEVQAAVSGKADKSEIPSLAGYATETYVQEQVSGLASEEYVQSQVSGKQDELEFTYDSENKITSIDGHGIAGTGGGGGSEYIPGQYISIQNDVISVTGLQPSGDYQPAGQYLTTDDLNGYATEEYVQSEVSGKADKSEIPSVAGLASEQYVDEHIEEATSGKADKSEIPSLQGYATESWVNDQGFLKEVPQGYATTEDVEAATSGKMDKSQSADFYPMASNPSGYLTEHQSLAGYATQEWVNQQGFVDDDDVRAATSGKMDASAYTAPVNADWSATSGLSQILNKPETEDLTPGQYISIQAGVLSVTGLQEAGSYATENYVQSQVSGKQDELQFNYDDDQMISGINGSAIKSGDSLPEGVMNTSGLEYTAGGQISAYNDSAFCDVALNDLVNQNSGAWGGSGLNVSAGPGIKLDMVDNTLVASLDETLLYSGTEFTVAGSDNPMTASVSLSESINNFDKIRLDFSGGNVFTESVTLAKPTIGTTNIAWYNVKKEQKSNSIYVGTMYRFTDANTLSGKCSYGDTQVVNNMTGGYWGYGAVFRVVGINRVAGGN